jgi:hypothetical protein
MKNRVKVGGLLTVVGVLGAVSMVRAQADYLPPLNGTILPIWQTQGEYYGTQTQDSTKHLGAWIVANGGSSYGLVVLPNGLLPMPGQPYGGWDKKTLYQGASGPANGTLNNKIFNVSTTSGGYVSDSITGTGEEKSLYLHNGSTTYVLHRVKRHSPTLGLKATKVAALTGGSGVVSLFDSATGSADLSKWVAQENAPKLLNGYLYRGIHSVATMGRVLMHIEFFSCFNPTATDQGRANSGIYQQGRYETQVLDNFGMPATEGKWDKYGAIYSIKDPPFNAELPPQVTLQTYDIYFTPRSSGGEGDVAGAAYFTVYANGVLVQDSTLAVKTTTASYVGMGTSNSPLYLQNHGNEVSFNNIWYVPNATPASLPYTSILAAALPPDGINAFEIKSFKNKSSINMLGLGDGYDLTGRHVFRKDGVELSVQPLVVPKDQAK